MRLAHLLLPTALLTATLAAPTSAAALKDSAISEREQRVTVALSASSEWIRKGDTVTLSGKVRGTAGRTQITIFQKKLKRGSDWNVEARKRTTRKGKFRHSENILTGHRMYKACVRGRCSTAVTVRMGTPPPPPPPANQPTAVALGSVSTASTEAGVPFTVTGSAINLDGQMVQVQAYDSGSTSWGAVGSAVVSDGRWSSTATVSTAGRAVALRAFFPGAPGLGASSSASSSITVFGWYYLYDTYYDGPVTKVADSNDESWSAYNVNGVNYSKSVGLDGYSGYTSYVEFNLGRACTRFAYVAGLSDVASTTTRSTGRVILDSVTKWTQAGMGLGAAYPATLDITGGLRLRLENSQTTSGSGDLVYGDARVLCAF